MADAQVLDTTREKWRAMLRYLLIEQGGLWGYQLQGDLLPLLLAPLGPQEADRLSAALVDVSLRHWDEPEALDALIVRTVDDLLHAIQAAGVSGA